MKDINMLNIFQRELTEINSILFEKMDPINIKNILTYDEMILHNILKRKPKVEKPALLIRLFWYHWIREGLYSVLLEKQAFSWKVNEEIYIRFLKEMQFPLLIFSRNWKPLPPSWLLKPFGRNIFRHQEKRDEWINYGNICLNQVKRWLKKNDQNNIMTELIRSLQNDFGNGVTDDWRDPFGEIPAIKRMIATSNKRRTNQLIIKR